MSAGAAILAIGIFLLSLVSSSSRYLFLVPGMCVLGFAVSAGFSRGPKRSPAHRAVPPGHHRARG